MGKKNRRKTTWRRLSLNGDETDGPATVGKDQDGQDPTGARQQPFKKGPSNGSDHYRHPRYGSQASSSSSSSASSSSSKPPFLRRSWTHRPFLVQGPVDAVYSVDQSSTPFVAAAPGEEELENGDGLWSPDQMGQFHPYFYPVPPYTNPSLIYPPPFHPLQWYEDPRLPADCQYYFCLTQPFPQPSMEPTLQPAASTSQSSPEGSEDGSDQGQPAAPSEDGCSACPAADDYDPQLAPPPVPIPMAIPAPPYVYPGAFMFKPYGYHANNSYFWWNDNGVYFGRGGKRRRRRGFVGGEGITYDRWPSRKDRAATDFKSKSGTTTTTKDFGQTSVMNANDTSNSNRSPEVHDDRISKLSPDDSTLRHDATLQESPKVPESPLGLAIATNDHDDSGRLPEMGLVPELPDVVSGAKGPPEEARTVNARDAPVQFLDTTVPSGDAVSEVDEIAKPVSDGALSCNDGGSVTADPLESTRSGSVEDHATEVRASDCPFSFVNEHESTQRLLQDDLDANPEVGEILPHLLPTNPFGTSEFVESTSGVDAIPTGAIDTPHDSGPLYADSQSGTSWSHEEVGKCLSEQSLPSRVTSDDQTTAAAIMEVAQPQSVGSDAASRSPASTTALPSSSTSSTPTAAHRLHYEQLEDPLKCTKYYQLCTDGLEDVTEFEPSPFVESHPTATTVVTPPVGSEIVVHEADSASECGSEDVEMIGHRYETAAEKKYKNNTLSLAVELMRTNQQLPYDGDFKPLAEEGPANVCYTNTQILESYYGQISRKSRKQSKGDGVVVRREVADSGIHTDESADEGEHRNRNLMTEDEEILFSRSRGTSAFQYQPFGRPRSEYSPLIYLRSRGPWQGCCCNVM